MALSDDTINRYADACTPNTETGSLNYKAFASAIEAEVRKEYTELIQQLVEALEYHRAQTRPIDRTDEAITAGRARLEGKP